MKCLSYLFQEMPFISRQTEWDVAKYVNTVIDQMPQDFNSEPTFS